MKGASQIILLMKEIIGIDGIPLHVLGRTIVRAPFRGTLCRSANARDATALAARGVRAQDLSRVRARDTAWHRLGSRRLLRGSVVVGVHGSSVGRKGEKDEE